MSNTQYDPRPQGRGGAPDHMQAPPQSDPQQTYQEPTGGKPEPAFFRWIRESRVERTDDRVIGGVCGAIARELGWNVTLVRVLMAVSVLFGGFGALLYGMGWMLLPDESDHRILLEEIIEGRWDWSFLGVILCVLIAGFGVIPGGFLWWSGGWGLNLTPLLIAMLVLYLLIDNGRRRFRAPQPGTPPYPGAAGGGYGCAPNGAGAYGAPANPAAAGRAPRMADPTTPSSDAYRQQTAPGAAPFVPPRTRSGARPAAAMPGAASPAPPSPASPIAYRTPAVAAEPRRARRRPAGAALVLLVFGAILASTGIMELVYKGREHTLPALQGAIVYVGAVCAAIGLVIVALGVFGRRAGGLHPFAWIAMVLACCMMAAGGAWTVADRHMAAVSAHYTRIGVGPDAYTIGSSDALMKKLADGIAVEGDGYDVSTLDIDLSDYAKHHKPTTIRLNDGSTATSDCPTGVIPMTVRAARVVVTLPRGCSWDFGEDYTSFPIDGVGGRNSFMTTGDAFTFVDVDGEDGAHVRVGADGIEVHDADGTHVRVGADGILVEDPSVDGDEDDVEDEDDALEERQDWFASASMAGMCRGVSVEDGKVVFDEDANADTRRLVKEGRYWPCAVDADKAPAVPQLRIDPKAMISGGITVRYAA